MFLQDDIDPNVSRIAQEFADEYLGCFRDAESRAFPFKAPSFLPEENPVANANDYCREVCFDHGYTHYGLQNHKECYCGFDTYDIHGELPESSCNYECRDQTSDTICGGNWASSVYRIGVTYPFKKIFECMKSDGYEPYTNPTSFQTFNLLFNTNTTLDLRITHGSSTHMSAMYMAFIHFRSLCCEVQMMTVLYAHQTFQYPADVDSTLSTYHYVDRSYLFYINEAWGTNNFTLWTATIEWLSSRYDLTSIANNIFKDAYLWDCMPSDWPHQSTHSRCNRPATNDVPTRPSTSSRLHWFDPLYSYLDVDLMPIGDTVFDFVWHATNNPTPYGTIYGYDDKNVLFGTNWLFRLSEEELEFLTGIKNFDFNGDAFTKYKNFVLEYGIQADFPLLASVYDFTSDDLKYNIERSMQKHGPEYLVPRIQWDPTLIFLTLDNNILAKKRDGNTDVEEVKKQFVNTILSHAPNIFLKNDHGETF